PPSLHQTIQDSLKAYITENNLEVGDPLPSENALSKQLGVSRNLVREAIRGLETLGIVEIRRGSGLYVGEFSFEMLINNLQFGILFDLRELTELFMIRRALETGMIKDAIQVKTSSQVRELKAILEAIRKRAEGGDPFPEEDRRFHRCLFEPLDNRALIQILDSFWLALNKANQVVDIQDRDPLWTYNLHVPIVESFESGDVEATRNALDEHHIGLEMRLTRLTKDDQENSLD
ncbi:MAG: FadR family transcriptional regulator, partial [Anaerolineae bacterium]|nr:FadR family transcriptional regulator [Anaerolineae bacterium]